MAFLWWLVRWTFAAVAFVALMALTGFYVFNRATAAGNHVTVPNIVDLPLAQAVLELQQRDLELGEPERVSSDKPEFQVLAQRPPAGSVVRSGRKVYPTISARDPQKVPNLLGKTQEEATQLAAAHGFDVNPRASRIPHSAPRDTVIGQDPAADLDVGEGKAITLLLSDGPQSELFLMPELVGRRASEVPRILEPLGVEGQLSPVDAPDQPFDVVLAQAPPAGTWVQAGMKVVYQVRTAAAEPAQPTVFSRRFTYQVPFSWSDRVVRLDFVDHKGARHTEERLIRGGDPARLSLDFRYPEEATVEVHIDGRKVKSYYYKGNNEPIVLDY